MVRFISANRTLPIRSEILRDGKPLEQCIFPTDNVDGAFHLGFFNEDDLVGVASFFPSNLEEHLLKGYQLRGMAIKKEYAGKGFGTEIIKFALIQLKGTEAIYIWCNARLSAVDFYLRLGFEICSETFEIEGVGPHKKMILNL